MCLLAACGSEERITHSSLTNNANTNPDVEQSCNVSIRGETLFIGKPACMRKLPPRRMSGLWVLGHEHSVFYENALALPSESNDDVWLHAEPYNALRQYGVEYDGKTHVYKIDFIGTRSDAAGVYGHGGVYKRGALLLRVISLEEVGLR